MCCSEYVKSLLALQSGLEAHKHQMTCVFLGNESLIQRARNTIVHIFLKTDASHLLFMDGDQSFRSSDVAKMIKADKGIIAGPVPMKGINWDRVRYGALSNHPNLSELTGIFNIQEGEEKMTDPNVPFRVKYAGTGFMLIRRDVFEDLMPHLDWYESKGNSIPVGEKIYNFFQVENVDNHLLSEDFNFCNLYRRHCNGEIWLAPWCEVGHFGAYHFSGQYAKSFT